MKLKKVIVKNFRNIIDSEEVTIQDDITCLVGKNESGKTAFLHALYRLNPARPNAEFIVTDEYPAWLEKMDRKKGIKLEDSIPIRVEFEIEKEIVDNFESKYGKKIFVNNILILEKAYAGKIIFDFNISQKGAINNLLKDLTFSREARSQISKIEYVINFRKFIEDYKPSDDNTKDDESISILSDRIKDLYGDKNLTTTVQNYLKNYIPKFIYFDEYSTLPYSVNIKEIMKSDPKELDNDELTARSLLKLAGAENDYLLNPDYERRKRELENVANAITQDVIKYWSQNDKLRVHPDITTKNVNAPNGTQTVIDELKIRIWDDKHLLSLPFDKHSSGFQWFFSFLAAFSEYEYSDEPVIILLDEPGLGLHGKAQSDFLRFIEERLAKKCQVIYTTHSPFMVQPGYLERARIVEEKDPKVGAKITQDVLTNDPDTLFPLQGAIGYDLVQNMFISENNVLLEGTSDYSFLSIFSDYLKDEKRESLNEKWSLIPVGGADLIPTFVALLGIHLDVTVVVDSRSEGHQKLTYLAEKGYLKKKRIITIGKILGKSYGDIEDLFETDDYLNLYNKAFRKSIKSEELTGSDSITAKIARIEGIERYDHGKPADVLLREKLEILPNFNSITLDNFENLIKEINKTFKK